MPPGQVGSGVCMCVILTMLFILPLLDRLQQAAEEEPMYSTLYGSIQDERSET